MINWLNSVFNFHLLISRWSLKVQDSPYLTTKMSRVKKRYDNIVKSVEDKRLYRGLELENDLKILLISDPTTDKSAAALNVNIGKIVLSKDKIDFNC